MLGSPNHVISPFNGAIAAVHLSLVSLPLLTALPLNIQHPQSSPLKFASQATRASRAYVDAVLVPDWDERWQDGVHAARMCEELFQSYLAKFGKKSS